MRGFVALLLAILLTGVAFHFVTKAPLLCDPDTLQHADNADSIKAKCGPPNHINVDSYGEQWVYADGFPNIGGDYIYLSADKHFRSAQWRK